jgi:hypothetical protein
MRLKSSISVVEDAESRVCNGCYYFETFRAQAAALRDGEGLPRFVEDEFQAFLRCGWLAGGFARFRCTACGTDRCEWARYLVPVRQTEWVVYAKRPFAGPQQVLDYVGRYTHRVALSNNRLLDIENGNVRFTYKDYRADPPPSPTPRTMTLAVGEFIRRFLLHVLPAGFHRIRYYGFLGARHRRAKLACCRQLLGSSTSPPTRRTAITASDYRDRAEALTGIPLRVCPACHRGEMIIIERLVPPARTGFVNPDTS